MTRTENGVKSDKATYGSHAEPNTQRRRPWTSVPRKPKKLRGPVAHNAAFRNGVLAALEEGPATTRVICTRMGFRLPSVRMAQLMRVLERQGFVYEHGRYQGPRSKPGAANAAIIWALVVKP